MTRIVATVTVFMFAALIQRLETVSDEDEDQGGWSTLPVVGILAQETRNVGLKDTGSSIVNGMPVKWLQMGAIRVVPIRLFKTEGYYRQLFSYLNGILLPGGSLNITGYEYNRVAKLYFDWAKEAFHKGDYFPIFGICLGFEMLHGLVAENYPLTPCNAVKFMDPFRPVKDFRSSRVFKDMPLKVVHTLSSRNITPHYHHDCVMVETFLKDRKLMNFYRVISTNKDRNGNDFVATIEAYDYPFYGFQWHPEKFAFHLNLGSPVPHDPDALDIGVQFAHFVASEAKKSKHTFPMPEILAAIMIDNIPPTFFGAPSFRTAWLITDTPPRPKSNDDSRL